MRNLGLDILRAVAVFLVLGRHLEPALLSNQFLQVWQVGGWIGVDLFFVLSGFLVSSLLFREYKRKGNVDLKTFLIRRAFKIYPAFWVLILFTMCLKGLPIWNRQVIAELLFVQNYFPRLWNHTWSLAVEEHFYIAIAVLFGAWSYYKPHHNFAAIPKMFIITAIVCLCFRIANLYIYDEYSNLTHMFATHLRIDSLAFGVLLSYYYHFEHLEQRIRFIPSWALLTAGILLLSPAFVFPSETTWWIPVFGLILFYVGSGLILLAALRLKSSLSPGLQWIGILGAASYSIYLWHMPTNRYGWRLFGILTGVTENVWVYLIVYIGGSLIVGLVMSRLVEFPVLLIRDRYFPSLGALKPLIDQPDTVGATAVPVDSTT
jgi:peptidoglycan/LPS O-acetylase OafA/YrhL